LNLFDFTLWLNGFPLKKAKQSLSAIQKKNSLEFQDHVTTQKEAIVTHHLQSNSFYRSFAKAVDSKNWSTIPVMTKRDLQQPLEQRLSDGFTTKNVYINKTSGSSGDPFIFAKDKFCHALTWAVIQHRFAWYDLDFNSSKQARFYGIPLDKKGYYKERFKDRLSKRHRFSVFDMSDVAFKKHIEIFKSTSFDYINGYTSAIVQFAKFLKQEGISLKSICPTLKACVVTSEMLFENDKTLLETQFEVPVINEYGASELDLIAFQNPKKEWQLNSETLFIEILDENDKPLPYGEEGRIVITSLYNKAHPFIRYDIGDIGILSEHSTVQKPILKKLVGRTNDIAVLPSGKKAAGLTFYYITKSIIEDDGKVKEFVVEQHSKSHFKILYVSTELLSEKKIEIIKKEMENRTKSGKLKQFSSYINSSS